MGSKWFPLWFSVWVLCPCFAAFSSGTWKLNQVTRMVLKCHKKLSCAGFVLIFPDVNLWLQVKLSTLFNRKRHSLVLLYYFHSRALLITPLALSRRQVYHVGFGFRYGRWVMDKQYPFSCVYFHVRKAGIGHFSPLPLPWKESSLMSGHLKLTFPFLTVAGCSCLIVCSVSLEILQVSAFLFFLAFFSSFFFNWV